MALSIRRRPLDGADLLSAYLLLAVPSASYRAPRRWVFYLPSFVACALAVSWGLRALQGMVGQRLHGVAASTAAVLIVLLVAAPPAYGALPRYREYRQDHIDGGALDRGHLTHLGRVVARPGDHRLSAAGLLARIGPAPAAIQSVEALPEPVRWRDGLELVGYSLDDGAQ